MGDPLPISLLFALHLGSCFFMTGVIWVVQRNHYPAFLVIPEPAFRPYHATHVHRIAFLAGPGMVVEGLSGAGLLALALNWWWGLNFASMAFIWAVTAFWLIPLHAGLRKAPDESTKRRVILANWPRTIAWTLRSAALLYVLTLILSGEAPTP